MLHESVYFGISLMVTMMMLTPWQTVAGGPLGISCLQTSYHSFTVSSFHFSHTSSFWSDITKDIIELHGKFLLNGEPSQYFGDDFNPHADFKDDAVYMYNFAAKLFCDKQTNFSN